MNHTLKAKTTAMLSQEDFESIASVPFFAHIPTELLASLTVSASVTTYSQAGLLFNHNEPADTIYVLLDGMVTISLYHEDGTQAIIDTITPVSTFAEAAAFHEGSYPATAEYTAGSKIIAIPVSLFLNQLESSSKTAFSILGSLALRERDLATQLDTLKLHSPTQRMIEYLLEQIPEDENGAYSLTLPFDKGLTAKKLGITAVSLSRLLARLSQYGVKNSRKSIHIANVTKLRTYLEDSKKKKR
ncbi:Crp/Fnr family transcriptional regulator [Magnetovibrio blakemorei]|uniref:Crp/Fnr family transcriptional regulator n=1 Tax=Magnetovibrio blakemorei TaxID=28181 RepID=A0A1E5Q371_9PROT|nr:cyclic nucleotide-binding domain-containing protein [Magnetovibrio blakemorei]OEJ63787.1 hypothetical protein BEN30_17270 [Magnetovibrio blakemorei]